VRLAGCLRIHPAERSRLHPAVPTDPGPSIFKHTDGYYYLTYTTDWTGNTIGFARGADRVNWTFLLLVCGGVSVGPRHLSVSGAG
jgi:hypothetical protein